MTKKQDAQQKAISTVCNEIKLLSLEALQVKRDGGNFYNVWEEVSTKTNELHNMIETFK